MNTTNVKKPMDSTNDKAEKKTICKNHLNKMTEDQTGTQLLYDSKLDFSIIHLHAVVCLAS